MPYFKNNDINVLYIHIPKTGGTSVENYFSTKFKIPLNIKSLFGENKQWLKVNSTLQHITYNQIVQNHKIIGINFVNIKIITVVRNPYERIISDLFHFKLITVDTSKETVVKVISQYVNSSHDNHNVPQHKFITNDKGVIIPNIHILKTENLTRDMHNLDYRDFNMFDNKNSNKVNYYNYLNNESINIINKVYHWDFILFKYDLKPFVFVHEKVSPKNSKQ